MTRRNAAWLAAAVATGLIVVAALYVATRRRPAPTPLAPQGRSRVDSAEPAPAPVAEPVIAPLTAPVVAAAPVAPPQAVEPVEPPLPTWVRLAIVGVALVAFFAVSLIATKGV